MARTRRQTAKDASRSRRLRRRPSSDPEIAVFGTLQVRIRVSRRGRWAPQKGRFVPGTSGFRGGPSFSLRRSIGRLLVQTDYIAARVPESCCNLGRVRSDRLHNLAAVSDDCVDGRGDTVAHYVNQEAGLA